MLDYLTTISISETLRLCLSTFFFTSAFWWAVLLVVIIAKKERK